MRYGLDAPFRVHFSDLPRDDMNSAINALTEKLIRDTVAELRDCVEDDGVDPHSLLWRLCVTRDVYSIMLSVTASDTEPEYPHNAMFSCDLKKWLDEKGENDEPVLLCDLQEVS